MSQEVVAQLNSLAHLTKAMPSMVQVRKRSTTQQQEMKTILANLKLLESAEIDLVIEFATRQQKFLGDHETVKHSYFSSDQRAAFISSLNAIAAADGDVSADEIQEIQSIAEDYGFPAANT